MRRSGVVAMLVVLLVVGGATAAFAHISFLDIDTFQGPSLDQLRAEGTIDCTQGETFLIKVSASMPDFKALARANGTCTGSYQQWVTNVARTFGTLEDGPCLVRVEARTSDGDRKVLKIHTTCSTN